MRKSQRILAIIIILMPAILLSYCGKDSSKPSGPVEPPVWRNDTGFVNVQWNPRTVIFDSVDLKDLVSADTAGRLFLFNESNVRISGLHDSDIVFIYGLELGRVKNITKGGGKVSIETEHINLNEAIASGSISWDHGIEFSPAYHPSMVWPDGKSMPFRKISSTGWEISFTINDIDFTVKWDAQEDSAEVSVVGEKSSGGASLKLELTGHIERFRSKAAIDFDDSNLKRFDYRNDNSTGEFVLTLIATSSQTSFNTLQEFPILLYEIPFVVGGIPVELKFKFVFIFQLQLPTIEASSWISTKFSYDASTGIKYDGITTGLSGGVGDYKIEKKEAQTGGIGAVHADFGVGFPRIEVSMFRDIIVPWIHTSFLIGGDFETGTHPCQLARADFIGACGFNFEFMGLKLDGTKTLWHYSDTLLKSGDCNH